MHIAFITSCLEAGKDGVGDYARDIAAGCIRLGHSCVVVAINDRQVDEVLEQTQISRGTAVEVLRLPARDSWNTRVACAGAWLNRRPIDWISLQFVPYGFDPRGVVGRLGERLAPLAAGRRLHMMFHELWIGAERDASPKQRLIGWAQRQAVLETVSHLSPHLTHTSNPAYRSLLAARGIKAGLLPLFGNIPVIEGTDKGWLFRDFEASGIFADRPSRTTMCWWFGLFGSLHFDWKPEPLFARIAEAAELVGRHVVIASIGRQGPGESVWRDLLARYSSSFSFVNFGERSTIEISEFLQAVDFGIATTPWQLIGKSGTVAAMLEHGLPVIVSRDDVRFVAPMDIEPVADVLLHKMDSGFVTRLATSVTRLPARERLAHTTAELLLGLDNCNACEPLRYRA